MLRVFVGLELPPVIKQHVAMLCGGVPGARWQRDDQLHITLRFIGEVERPKVADIIGALGRIHAPAFTMRLDGVDIFGEPSRPRLLWSGVAPQDGVRHLRDKVEASLVRTGLPPETRKFTPHMTLARFGREKPRRLVDFLTQHSGFASGEFEVEEFVLFESRMGHAGGSVYHPIERFELDTMVAQKQALYR